MGQRSDLQELLEKILDSENVYFQPPANVEMEFPAIVYQRDPGETVFADNLPYRYTKRYQVTVIDRDPDSEIPDRIAALPMCIHTAHFVVDNQYHNVFNLYF